MSEVAEKAAETTAEVVEETVDGVVNAVEIVRNNPVTLVAVGVLGLIAGGVGGYFVTKKRLKAVYEQLASDEIAEAKAFYASLNKVDVESGDVLSPMEILNSTHPMAAKALREYQGRVEAPVATEEELIAEAKDEQGHPSDEEMDERQIQKLEGTINVFDGPAFDLEAEKKHRTGDAPYIITHDEYFAAEKDYEQSCLTYYEKDDTLVDERDQPVREVDKVVGDDHLVRFGTGSGDKNIVYIRNDRLELDYEVVKSTGSYVEEVLGMLDNNETTLKHSDQRDRRRAFRHGDG